jgi:hypothetical protein
MTQPRPGFNPWLVHVGCVVNTLALGTAFSPSTSFSLVSKMLPMLEIIYSSLIDTKQFTESLNKALSEGIVQRVANFGSL